MKQTIRKIGRYLQKNFVLEPELPDPTFCDDYSRVIQGINLVRIRFYSIVLVVLGAVLIWRDIAVSKAAGLWESNEAYYELFWSHIALAGFSIVFASVSFLLRKKISSRFKIVNLLTFLYGLIIIAWAAFLSAWIVQKVSPNITEFIVAVFGIAASFFYRPAASIVLFTVGEIFFVVTLTLAVESPNASGHITNSIIFTFIAWLISRFTYTARLREFVNLRTIFLQKVQIENVNNELHQQNLFLAELNKEKNEFLGIAAHDLKNPLSGIILSAESIIRYGDYMKPEQKEKTVSSILATARRMKTIVTNLLDINAVESGRLTVNLQKFDATLAIKEIVESFHVTAEKKGISLHYEVVKQFYVLVDTTLFHEVIENIISNAVKYSPLNTNVFIVLEQISNDHGSVIRIAVKDEGPGLTDDDKQKLFGKFQRLSAQPTGGEHSSGLGLAIVKKLVEAMNGTIYCESSYGKGATFFVEFPHYSTESL